MSRSSSTSLSDDQGDYYDDPYDDLDVGDATSDSEQFEIHQAIELFKQNYPHENVTFRYRDSIQEVIISFSVSLSKIKGDVLLAWGIMKDLPLIVNLFVYPSFSQVQEKPKVHIYQTAIGNNSSVLVQLQRIVEGFCQHLLTAKTFRWTPADSNSSSASHERNLEQTAASNIDSTDCTISSEHAKRIPQSSQGFLVQLYLYVQQRLLSLNDFCPLCDERHDVGTTMSLLKPAVCEKPLCIFSSQTIGVISNVVECLKLQPKVVHLLIGTTMAAVFSKNFKLTFHPSIEVSNLHSGYKRACKDDTALLKETLLAMPSIKDMVTTSETDLKSNLNSCHSLCYPFLRWIISSNRSHIITLPEDKYLGFMHTDLQFLLCSSPPIEDAKFRALVKKYGSVFAFHGSPKYNWHSILRKGLIVASGTERQLNGKAYGKGIYLTPSLSLALKYSSVCDRDEGSDRYNIAFCLTLCEVVNTPALKKHGHIWLCPDSMYVCTRFIFGYRDPLNYANMTMSLENTDISNDYFIKLIKACLV